MTASDAARGTTGTGRAWIVFGLGTLCFTYTFFHRVAPSVMVDELMRDFAVSGVILGNLSAVYFYIYASLQLPVGLLIDRWGPRRVLTVTVAFSALGSILFASAESVNVAYAGRLMIGAGVGFVFVGTLTLATSWFPAHRFAMLSGLLMLAGMGGAVIGQAPQAALVETIGWRQTVAWTGAAGAVLAGLIWLIVRDSPQSKATVVAAGEHVPIWPGLRKVVRRPQTWFIALASGLMSAPMLSFGGLWGVPYLMQTYGLARPTAAFTISFMMFGWAIGGPVAGWVSDHLRRRKLPLVMGCMLSFVTMLSVLYIPDLSLVAVRALLFVNGIAASAMVICYAAAREHNPGPNTGTAYGFVNMVTTGSGALFQPFLGWLLDVNWDGRIEAGVRVYSLDAYQIALATLPACLFVALIAGLLMRETWCRPVSTPDSDGRGA